MKFKSCVFIVLFIVLFLLNLILINTSFCASSDYYYSDFFSIDGDKVSFIVNNNTYSNELINLTNFSKILVLKDYNSYHFFCLSDNQTYTINSDNYIVFKNIKYSLFFGGADTPYFSGLETSSRNFSLNFNDNKKIIYSNFDIVNDNGDVVFQKPVLTLGKVLEKNSPVKMFQIMTHGTITYLIVFLVGLVAFWKAWQLLSKELRKA